jgi:hypothetical protein
MAFDINLSLGMGALRGWSVLDERSSRAGRLWCSCYLAFFNSCIVDIIRLATTLGVFAIRQRTF